MRSQALNTILIALIIAVLAGAGFMAWRIVRDQPVTVVPVVSLPTQKIPEFKPVPVINKGKESEEKDGAMEAGVRKINDAVVMYAKDWKGAYPESDIKTPCFGVSFCLKSSDINKNGKIYLADLPRVQSRADYYYRADNAKGTYCVKTPFILETDSTMFFQCTRKGCERIPLEKSCRQ